MEEWKEQADNLRRAADSRGRPEEGDIGASDLEKMLAMWQGSGAYDLYADALYKRALKDFDGATKLLKQILIQNPNDETARTNLATCYRAWVFHLCEEKAEKATVREVIRQGMESCPNSDILAGLAE